MAPRPGGVRTANCGGGGLGAGGWVLVIPLRRYHQSVTERAWYYALMLMRWLIDNYLRDAAQGKVREVVAGLARPNSDGELLDPSAARNATEGAPYSARQAGPDFENADTEFIPCDVAFV